MKARRFGSFALSVLLFCGLIVQFAYPASALSKDAVPQAGSPSDPPKERIVTSGQGLEKLSPDLRALVDTKPVQSQRVLMEQTTDDPLLVSAVIQPGTNVEKFFTHSIRSREVAGFQWVTGTIQVNRLQKLVSVPQVISVVSSDTYQTAEAPGLDDLRTLPKHISIKEMRALLSQGGPERLREQLLKIKTTAVKRTPPSSLSAPSTAAQQAGQAAPGILDVHDVRKARSEGYTGKGVVVGLVDTGVDFSHPDLQGTQAVIQDGPYAGWPFAYDVVSGANYALDSQYTVGPDNFWKMTGGTGYVHTLPVTEPSCTGSTCSANLDIIIDPLTGVSAKFTWPNTSKSGHYYYSDVPDPYLVGTTYYLGIGYQEGPMLPPVLIVSDEHQAGVYDTVYADINFNHLLTDPDERMSRDHPIGGADIDRVAEKDGLWDLSAGLLGWISDGEHQPPGVAVLYPDVGKRTPPAAGRLLVFIYDQDGHGTSCASQIAGQGQITDPGGLGPSNPLFAGGSAVGGVGGPVVPGMAPGAKIAAFQNGYVLPFDAWALATLGMDGQPGSGDEVNIVSNSWGESTIIEDGWDALSRFAQQISFTQSPDTTFLVAAGNGGYGYGTRTAPGGGSILDVGASTAYGAIRGFEKVGPEQFLYGEVQPWSNRGPGTLGDIAPDITAVGAWGTGAMPLNLSYGDGQQAYDVFGGTSMSTPIAAGNMALIYQAFYEQNHRWPTWEEARSFISGSAKDLGYDMFVQGAGNIQASRAVDMALDRAASFTPDQWQAGSYKGKKYPGFPAVLHAGEQDTQAFTVKNPTSNPVTVDLSSSTFQRVQEETFTYSFSTPAPNSKDGLPIFLKDLSGWINDVKPDMIRAQVALPFTTFDVDRDGLADNWWSVALYDWKDLNGNGKLWTDLNDDGKVEDGEIEIDPKTGLFEFNRFTYGYSQADTLEASLGSQGLSEKHEGVYLGLSCYFCSHSTSLQVRVTFYKKVAWDWMTLPAASLQVPTDSQANFSATISVPADAKPGAYEGAINVLLDGQASLIPVVANVAANSATFDFGGPADLNTPYDNSHLFGGFNWYWRYESGDWRLFYTDIPEGASGPGKSLVVDTRWGSPDTDVDTWVLGPAENLLSQTSADIFGPQGMQVSEGSADTYVGGGKFRFKTNTGYSREVVSGPVQSGLNAIVLHNVLNGGLQLAEEYAGKVFQVSSNPGQLMLPAQPETNNLPYLSGSQKVTLNSTGDMEDGIQVQAFGMNPPIELPGQVARQNSTYNICSSTWIYKEHSGGLKIDHGGLLDITTSSQVEDMDLDLYLYQDDGDGKWNCLKDVQKTSSIKSGPDEHIRVEFPEDGRYWIVVLGNDVPDSQQPFDINIQAISGSDLTLRNLPLGPIQANQPVAFDVDYHGKYPVSAPSGLEGLLMIGTPSVPYLLEVPVQVHPSILLYPPPELTSPVPWIAENPIPLSLSFQNQGTDTENVHAQIQLPEGLLYQAGSARVPNGQVTYSQETRQLDWTGTVSGGEKVNIQLLAAGLPGFTPGQALVTAQVVGITSGQNWSVSLPVRVNQYGLLFPFVRR